VARDGVTEKTFSVSTKCQGSVGRAKKAENAGLLVNFISGTRPIDSFVLSGPQIVWPLSVISQHFTVQLHASLFALDP
jgi:hypothetical protein